MSMGAKSGDCLGQYRLGEQIGVGGMARVFAAIDEPTGRAVAIKVLLKEAAGDRQIEARFLQEGRALATLQHPSIVKVFACERTVDGTAYLVMELVAGSSLRSWLESRGGRATPTLACSIGQQIADTMVHVHRQGIVHRDLKPENIMLSSSPLDISAAASIKLLDFGIARVPPAPSGSPSTQVLTEDHTFLGTPQYMAPEQGKGNNVEVTAKADVYALGVLLFEMVAGELPFNGEEHIDFVAKHIEATPPALRDLAPDASEALGVLISSMLAKDPKVRPTMRRCRVALEEISRKDRDECPLPGLQPFTEAQAELFFGRRAEVDEIKHRLDQARTGERRWVQIEGSSGVGKSSLVQAGVRLRLEDDQGPDGPRWLVTCLRPTQSPLRALAQALLDALSIHGLEKSPEEVLVTLREDPNALRELAAHTPPGRMLLIVVEQMEELFTLGIKEAPRFDDLFAKELVRPESPLRLLTTLRSDFLHRLELMPRLSHLLNEASRYHLHSMDEEALRQVILGMAERAGMQLSDRLAARIVRDTASTDCRLPLLGHALRALWSSREEPSPSIEQRYEEIGGVGGALGRHADRLLASLNDEEREHAKWIVLELIQVGHDAPDTRRTRTRQEVLAAAGGGWLAEQVLELLSGARHENATTNTGDLRLLVLSAEQDNILSQQHVDLIHETLLQQVPLILRWIKEERSRLECYADLEAAALVWEQTGRRSDALASGALLEHYRGYRKKELHPGQLSRMTSKLAQGFLTESELRERRIRWIKHAITTVLVIAAVVTFMSAIYAFSQKQEADDQRQAAETARSDAIEEKNHAKENLLGLIKNIDGVVSNTDWKSSRNPGNLESRDELLTSLDRSLGSLSEQDRQTIEIIDITIKTKHRRGDLALHDGTLRRAEEFYDEARTELERIPIKERMHGQWRDLAFNHSKLGKVALARNRLADAQDHFDKSLILLKLAPSGEGANRSLAASYEEMADLEVAKNRQEEAALLYDEAVRLFSMLEQNDYHRSLLAEALCASAATANRRKLPALAKELLSRAQSTVPQLSVDTYSRMAQARIYIELGVLNEAQEPREALRYYQLASNLGETLHQGDPTRKSFTLVLIESLHRVITTASNLPEHEVATSARRKLTSALEHLDIDKEDVRFQVLVAP